MNTKTRTQFNSRPGVTLLFTISMIVLFLLMGTTFVVVANDYFKTANRRSGLNTNTIRATALLDRAFYDAFRGVALDDTSSSLRGMGVLEDQYGYGFRTELTAVAAAPTASFRTLSFSLLNADPDKRLLSLHDGSEFTPAEFIDGFFNGQVVTIIGGVADGYSTRIVSTAAVDITAPDIIQIVIPTDTLGINWTGAAPSVLSDIAGGDATIVINGRDFSGTGAGIVAGAGFFDRDGNITSSSLTPSLSPNQTGLDILAAYLTNPNSPNEDYDAPDIDNMYLSGSVRQEVPVGSGVYEIRTIPSFHRDSLYIDQQGGAATPDDFRQFSFRPVYISSGGNPASGSTANADYDSKVSASGMLTASTRNDVGNLDVDNTNDGTNDSVWIDIGLPVQTDDQGRRFRPLVAYHIIDMDNRLNINAHGSYVDQELPAGSIRRGGSYGVAEVSLSGALTAAEYTDLLAARSGIGDLDSMGNPTTVPGSLNNSLGIEQKLYGYVGVGLTVGGVFSTTGDVFGQFTTATPMPFASNAFPGFTSPSAVADPKSSISAYAADFSVIGGVGDSHFQAFEMERLLRPNDIDSFLASFRPSGDNLFDIGSINSNPEQFTTDSFEVNVPTSRLSVFELLRDEIGVTPVVARALLTTPGEEILPPEVLMGGKFNLNRPFGNGLDDDGDGLVDELDELFAGETGLHGNLDFDLNNDGTINAEPGIKQDMARHLYSLALLVCGDDVPPQFVGTITLPEYYRAVAQWAVNVVDFYDHDSKMTVFEYDLMPFNDPTTDMYDGDPTTDTPEDDVVIGVERPELLLMETMAFHSRENEDLSTDPSGDDRQDGDPTWDSRRKPISGAYFEIYNPWLQTVGARRFQSELDPTNIGAIDLAVSIGGTPVWRLAVQRGREPGGTPPDVDDPDFIRTIYFTTPPAASGATADLTTDNSGTSIDQFSPSVVPDSTIAPGEHMVIGSSGNIPGRSMSTFGRPITGVAPDDTRSIELNGNIGGTDYPVIIRDWDGATITASPVPAANCKAIAIDMPRSLSLSDPTGDYPAPPAGFAWQDDPLNMDGQVLTPDFVFGEPLDNAAGTHRSAQDMMAIWSNGIYKGASANPPMAADRYQFRIVHLQRLADPTLPWDEDLNPYVTVDTANVDLLAYNGTTRNPSNDMLTAGSSFPENSTNHTVVSMGRSTQLTTAQRADEIPNETMARQQFFRTGQSKTYPSDSGGVSDGHTLSFSLEENLGTFSDLYDTTGANIPLGWLTWNDRPFANHLEITHVPTGSPAKFLNQFNVIQPTTAPTAGADKQELFSYYMGDPQFGHLIGFGHNPPGGAFVNRFDRLLDFVEVPNRFLGSEKFLPTSVPASGALLFGLNAPFNSIPTFRTPGKINLNTISEINVWDAFEGNFTGGSLPFDTSFLAERDRLDGPSDFGGLFRSVSGAEYAHSSDAATKGATSLYRRPLHDATMDPMFDITNAGGAGGYDTDSSSYFKNEFRQRIASVTTTRSSVFSMWITIGYFEVDEFGRVGQELGSDEGQIQRNRAFYMVDRSIPVACEPGKNHNVDKAILVRTIIE